MSWVKSSDIMDVLKNKLGIDDTWFVLGNVWDKESGIEGLKISGYRKGVIYIETTSSPANSELAIHKKEIIKKVNQYFGEERIKNIKSEIT
ncbi:MAG: DUF721 domain-containing protein [Elusimicrobiota bacterium]|jgi:hypothetical protein|nr:DUF721 domain-containing protein [Elusimicrobiota bacterium]